MNRILIIAELHPQHGGDWGDVQTMALQAKMAGADIAKIQLYDTRELHGNDLRSYLEFSVERLGEFKRYCETIGIRPMASVFSSEWLHWYARAGFRSIKVAFRTSRDDQQLVQEILDTKMGPLGNDRKIPQFNEIFITQADKEFHVEDERITKLYTCPAYPTPLEDVVLPDFRKSYFNGYSDHCPGLTVAKLAITYGAKVIEKHFTLSHALQCSTEKGHTGSMDVDELRDLKKFALDYQKIESEWLDS